MIYEFQGLESSSTWKLLSRSYIMVTVSAQLKFQALYAKMKYGSNTIRQVRMVAVKVQYIPLSNCSVESAFIQMLRSNEGDSIQQLQLITNLALASKTKTLFKKRETSSFSSTRQLSVKARPCEKFLLAFRAQ